MLVVFVVTALYKGEEIMERVTFNPLGHTMDFKIFSDNEDFDREAFYYENKNHPYWSGTNYGSLEALTTHSTDANGSNQTQIGDAPPMVDMMDNANNESKFAPTPEGLTIYKLPGVQPDGKVDNLYSFVPGSSSGVIAPRNYYLNSESVTIAPTKEGDLTHYRSNKATSYSISVMKVPYGDSEFINDSTGTSIKASASDAAKEAVRKAVLELKDLAKAKTSVDQYSKHIFNSKSTGLSESFNNINNMINNGLYAESYKSGLSVGLGVRDSTMELVHGVSIKSKDGTINDVFDQFNYIHKVLSEGSSKYYSPALVKWGKKNAESITHTLMVNYFFQKQFPGTNGAYTTPIRMNKWGESKLSFYSDLVTKGRNTKEPFYLYTVIHPDATTGKKTLEPLNLKHVQPDLAYIFSLYTAIHTHIWVGANGVNTDGSMSQDWQELVAGMNKKINSSEVTGSKLPKDANEVTSRYSEYQYNNLVSGLSSQRGASRKAGTASVFPNQELVDSFRLLLSKGEVASGNSIQLDGKAFTITQLGETKYKKANINNSYLYSVFVSKGGDTYDKWATMINATDKIPLSPAVFSSHWDTTSSQAGYVMMPILMGGTQFPDAIITMLDTMRNNPNLGRDLVNLSYTNRYIMAFNFKSSVESKSTNTKGLTEVAAGKTMGTRLDSSKPIVLTGYLGGQTFSLVDYFKVYDSMMEGRDNPNLKVVGANGKTIQVKYLNLFKDFFTVKSEKDFIGAEGKGNVKYTDGFNKEGYITKYSENKSKSLVSQISPDYSAFFTGEVE